MENKILADSESYNNRKRRAEIKKETLLSILSEMEQLNDFSDRLVSKSEICRRAGVCRSFLRNHNELMDPVNNVISRNLDKLYHT